MPFIAASQELDCLSPTCHTTEVRYLTNMLQREVVCGAGMLLLILLPAAAFARLPCHGDGDGDGER